MIRVLLVDDEALALDFLKNIISWEFYDFEIVGALTDAGQALKLFRKTRPELVITDVRMYGMDGIDFSAAVKEIDPSTHILFLSGYRNFEYVQEAIALGIDDYLLKSDLTEEHFLAKILKIKERIEKDRQKKVYTEAAIFKELFSGRHEERHYRELLSESEYIRLHKKYCYIMASRRKAPSYVEQFIPDVNDDKFVDEVLVTGAIREESGRYGIHYLYFGR
jgi:YesN/AraC family two-component response regulator